MADFLPRRAWRLAPWWTAAVLGLIGPPAPVEAGDAPPSRFVDLSLLVAPGYPCNWPTWSRFQIIPEERIGPLSPYNTDVLIGDGNVGTQLDVPTHSVTPADSGLPNAGPFGKASTETIPAWQFGGEACVLDCRDLLDTSPPGQSPLVKRARVEAWEREHRPLGPGDVVLFRSGFTDRYYRPLPEGRRFLADPVEGKSPAWPDPDPDCMEALAARKVRALGTDSASMGPLPDLAEPTHYAGLKHGMIWAESLTRLGGLPPTGAFYCLLSPKFSGSPYAEARALAIVGGPLADRLNAAVRARRVVDLSARIGEELPDSWTGPGIGNHRQPYLVIRFGTNPNTQTPFEAHLLSSHAGTHLVPPSYALPPRGFDNASYEPRVLRWLSEYETRYGRRGESDVTAERVPLDQGCGPARVVDVTHLLGSTDSGRWPASPEITPEDLRRYEQQRGPLGPGDIVLFRSGWSDRFDRPLPAGKAAMEDPLNGRSEGWPAPGPEAIVYLASKGIRCVGTDAPSLGGVEPMRALMTYWALGGKGMIGVEHLTNLARLPEGADFLFAPLKIQGCHGGPGRALGFVSGPTGD